MPTKSKLLLAAALTFALPALPAAAAGEPAKSQSDSAKGTHKDKKSDKPAKQPVMLPQPATTDPMPAIDLSRFGDKPADEAFGAFQRGLYLTAFNLAKPQAEKGDPASQTLIAEMYARGMGIPADQKLAAEWYGKAAEKGITEAQFRYAALLLQGTYVKKDQAKAEALMQKAAEGGNAMAQFNWGQMLMVKHPGKPGLDLAFPWFEKAAEAKLADGEYAMSQIYANGTEKIARDDNKARTYLIRAARKGYDTAQFDLGRWLVEGRGGDKDYEQGFRWIQIAAGRGMVMAQVWLARLYRDGIGTDGDSVKAAAWYIIAQRAGFRSPDLNDLMDGLADDQIKQAIETANDLRVR
ncbi:MULTISPECIES: tetratricopeptide repeat protein [Brucella/Ochrobactrum group]|uniref:Tetratricopeptide repeat protein n=2 Tax=Ochrobactrum TaxID=528 RepID=A0ABD5JY20_9HYPH|nr:MULTISPECIES: tetratricopeptide repeat protein [Brucella]MCI0999979.1 sel1 repeat family protein [Ochrobactrum sp. C6C9]RRD24213.1 sel1 repeat family protein [Brucellaceae bacterium VT-16-1752]WHT41820.1 tetratricopeptide repeat protein [Ochrobactrum sp. SSR]MDX4073513.1 tetratricopeptide repeat protein [Brucella sp. NBRC 113783]RLL73607.1 sel1 repeat family protein [[Ochrobactrum] soli]